jgi:L-asparaginase II
VSERYAGGVPLAEVVRSDFVESRHLGSYAALDADGALVAWAGDPHGAVFPRSANKPMQAVAMWRNGLRPPDQADLALVAASHHGESFHIERVRGLLASAGVSESDLRCPPDLPLAPAAREAVLRAGGVASRVYMNCSGKHAGMLATCVVAGWPLADYVEPDHPLQKSCRTAVEDLSGQSVAAVGVDGCGAAVMAIPLTGLARAFLRVVSAGPGTPERSVADAMRAHPEMMSGTGATDARLMRAVPGLLAKGGAEGVLAVAVPGVGAVAIKIDDGAARATPPVLVAALGQLGLTSAELDEAAEVPVLGGGARVGVVRATRETSHASGS